jgi:RNA polymerase sigma-70 factor (ECF subfamily)
LKGLPVQGTDERGRFAEAMLPHLDAAYNLARWLTRTSHDAEDVVQEAYYRALKFFGGFRGSNGRTWLLQVVRNTAYTWLQQHRAHELTVALDEERSPEASEALNPEKLAIQRADRELIRQAIEELPVAYREVVVLRELEGLQYQQIAEVAGIPLGTVMSRLARARGRLQERLTHCVDEER